MKIMQVALLAIALFALGCEKDGPALAPMPLTLRGFSTVISSGSSERSCSS